MELREFVADTLKQIIDGVKDAQEHGNTVGAIVNPTCDNYSNTISNHLFTSWGQVVKPVEFDVALASTDGTTTKGGIGVWLGAVGLGSQGESRGMNESTTRVKFSVNLTLPENPMSRERERARMRERENGDDHQYFGES